MNSRTCCLAATVLATLLVACAPTPKDNGSVLTLPPTTAAAPPTTLAPLAYAATAHVRATGTLKAFVTLDRNNSCVDDRRGTLTVSGTAADGSSLVLAVARPAAGTFPIVPAPPTGPQIAKLTLVLAGKDTGAATGGDATVNDPQGHKGTLAVSGFTALAGLHANVDWVCGAALPSSPPTARP